MRTNRTPKTEDFFTANSIYAPPLPAGIKYDEAKPEWYLLPLNAVKEIVKVLTHGKKKYAAENWKYVDEAEDRYFSATLRHIEAHQSGELRDADSGLLHLAHAACCIIFLIWFELRKES